MARPSLLRVLLVVSLAGGSGCGLILDVAPADPDAATPSFDARVASDAGSASDAGAPRDDASAPLEDAGVACGDHGAPCPLGDTPAVCVDGECVPSTCGDGVVDPRTEGCDDGNIVDGDGCDADCTRPCEADVDCDDGLYCTGAEACDLSQLRCVRVARECPVGDVCTRQRCDETADQCVAAPRDADGDGHFCETDCAPEDPAIHPGAFDDCDRVDDDCDERIDEDATITCFVDADGDGFGAIGSEITRCACRAGETTIGGDCYDHATDPVAAMVKPGLIMYRPDGYVNMNTGDDSFDWNCMNGVELQFTETVGFEEPACDPPTSPGMCRPDPRWTSDAIPFWGGVGGLVLCVADREGCVRELVEDQVQRCR